MPLADDPTISQEAIAPLSDLIGQTVAHFRIEEQIGSGAMSTVYRAIDTQTEETVALKILLPGADGVARSRFRQEARTALQLDHPQIIRTFQVGQTDMEGFAYISMELVEGESLADLLEQNRQLSIFDTCLILGRIARALDYAHGRGIVHRDVKPSNILLRHAEDGTPGSIQLSVLEQSVVPILSDFGIARALDAPELTTIGRTVGTPSYMAPEQCSGSHEIDGRADIYALGTVFYRCLVGRPPYIGTTTQVLYAHVYSPLTIPDEVLVNLPMPIIDILRRSLMKEPERRYATALAMAIDMARVTGNVEFQMGDSDVSMNEITATMTALSTTEPTTSTSSTVLVPSRQAGISPLTGRPASAAASVPPKGIQRRRTAEKPRTGVNRLAVGFAMVSMTLLLLAAVGLIRELAPDFALFGQLPAGVSGDFSETDIGGSEAQSSEQVQLPDESADSDDNGNNGRDGDGSASEVPGTPTPLPHPQIAVESAWDDAEFFYRRGDWNGTLEMLTLMFRNDEEFNLRLTTGDGSLAELAFELFIDKPEAQFWSDYAGLIDPQRVEVMLFDSFAGLAAQFGARNQIGRSYENFGQASIIRPDSIDASVLVASTNALLNAFPVDVPAARRDLQADLANYAGKLEQQEDFCHASAQLAAADGVLPDTELRNRLIQLEALCSSLINNEVRREQMRQLSGKLLYSTEIDGLSQIHSMPAQPDGDSTLLVNNAAQPALSPDGRWLAFYSTDKNSQGLWVVDPNANPIERGRHLTNFLEDGFESPAAWSPGGDRIAFSSTREADRKSRIYVSWSDGRDNRTIAFGTDPAWRPGQDWIVHNGIDPTGNQPGLWLRRNDGSEPELLTNIAGDLRPTWTPDGLRIVFTSDGRDGNRDLYRLDINQGTVSRLTSDPAQDVSPTVSPDGQYVAFYSDRDGSWGIWVIGIDGEQPTRLVTLDGTITDWRRHAIQWVE